MVESYNLFFLIVVSVSLMAIFIISPLGTYVIHKAISTLTIPSVFFHRISDNTYWTVADVDMFLELEDTDIMTVLIYQQLEQNRWGWWYSIDQYEIFKTVEERKEALNDFKALT